MNVATSVAEDGEMVSMTARPIGVVFAPVRMPLRMGEVTMVQDCSFSRDQRKYSRFHNGPPKPHKVEETTVGRASERSEVVNKETYRLGGD